MGKEAKRQYMKGVPGKRMVARSYSSICVVVNIDRQLGTDSDEKEFSIRDCPD